MICVFVTHSQENNIDTHTTGKNSMFYLVSVAEQTGLSFTLSETIRQFFLQQGQ